MLHDHLTLLGRGSYSEPSGCYVPHKEVPGWQPVHRVWLQSPPPHTTSLDCMPYLTAGLSHLPEFQRDAITPEETCLVSFAPNRTRRWNMTLLCLRVEHFWGWGWGRLSASLQSQSITKGSARYSQGWEPSGAHCFLFLIGRGIAPPKEKC